jgi:hypothetical protein
MLLINLESDPGAQGFTPEQAKTIINVARYLASQDVFGSDDSGNAEAMWKIEAIWGPVAGRPS